MIIINVRKILVILPGIFWLLEAVIFDIVLDLQIKHPLTCTKVVRNVTDILVTKKVLSQLSLIRYEGMLYVVFI